MPTFTAGDLLEDLDLDYPGAAQVLKRLQGWGCVRVVGFESPEGGHGRRRKLYEVTEHGRRKVEREKRRGEA